MSMYDEAVENFEAAAEQLELDEQVRAVLRAPMRELTVRIPLQLDNGDIRVYEGYRVQHSFALGPAKGGTRFAECVSLDEIKALALIMVLKLALSGVAMGGAKGGVHVDPSTLSAAELERLTRAYVTQISPFIGPDIDVLGPDIGTPVQVMDWAADTYSALYPANAGTAVTGRSLGMGGLPGRAESTGRGVFIVIREACRTLGIPLKGARVVVQGLGQVGSIAALLLHSAGCKVIAVADIHDATYNEQGIDIPTAVAYLHEHGRLQGFTGARPLDHSPILQVPCEILVPAAIEDQITEENAAVLQTQLVAEGANHPTSPEAGIILSARGIPVLPDILCNMGGVFISALEWEQSKHGGSLNEAEVNAQLEQTMTRCFHEVQAVRDRKHCDYRMAAYLLAVSRVAEATLATAKKTSQRV